MTDSQRQEVYRVALQKALDSLKIQYGFVLRAVIITEQYGELIQHRPALEAVPVAGGEAEPNAPAKEGG